MICTRVANIICRPNDRHPLVEELELVGIAVKNLQKKRHYKSQLISLNQSVGVRENIESEMDPNEIAISKSTPGFQLPND